MAIMDLFFPPKPVAAPAPVAKATKPAVPAESQAMVAKATKK